jgi:hypothetical protein
MYPFGFSRRLKGETDGHVDGKSIGQMADVRTTVEGLMPFKLWFMHFR